MIWPFSRTAKVESKSLLSPEEWLNEIFGITTSAASVSVTPTTAMQATPVRRAVQAIAEPIGQLPLHVFRREGDSRVRDREHPVAKALAQPNDWTSASDFREQLQRDCLLHGNAFAYINRVNGQVAELIRIDPARVQVRVDAATGEPAYRVTTTGGASSEQSFTYSDLLHLKAPSLNGYEGKSIVSDCKEAIGVALVLEKHTANFFARASRPGGVITTPKNVGDEGVKKILAAWKLAQSGADNAGKTPVLWDGAEFKPIAFNSVDSQLLELRQFTIDEIARAFGVPPTLLYELGRATWGNADQMGATFVTFTLMRWVKAWQGEIALKLFAPEERGTWYAEFLLDDLLKADISARANAYSQLITSRVMNPNEARAKENLPPYAGGDKFENPNTSTSGAAGNGA